MKKVIALILSILLADQSLKFWIKTHMLIGDEIPVIGHWFNLHFVENRGMAFGFEFGGDIGKLILTSFRIIAVILIGIFLTRIVRKKQATSFIISISMIFAGAIGNIIDSVFYGVLFSRSTYHQLATFLPQEGGYSSFLHGKVVDMLYFPLFHFRIPDNTPIWGGERFDFFQPVFNIADASISVGVALLLLFNRQFLKK